MRVFDEEKISEKTQEMILVGCFTWKGRGLQTSHLWACIY